MKYFFTRQARVWSQLKHRRVYLFLDYDGTLTPIVRRPGLATLSLKTRAVLKTLSEHPRCVLAIISGRSLADIKKLVKLPEIIYSGSHGFEVDYHGIQARLFKDARFYVLLHKLYAELRQKMKGIKGILLENKTTTLSVHYRLVAKRQVPVVKSMFADLVRSYVTRRQVAVTSGKMVLEIHPPVKWGKGDMVKWLLHDLSPAGNKKVVFYFGDDRSDEEAFKVLKGKGYAIMVGKNKRSAAEFYLKNTVEVRKVLEALWHALGE